MIVLLLNKTHRYPRLFGLLLTILSTKRMKYNNLESHLLDRICKFNPQYILPYVNKKLIKLKVSGINFNFYSRYLLTFKYKGLVCAGCGMIGQHIYLEHHHKTDKPGIYHLKLYGINSAGVEVQMTMDHKLPRSKGGKDNLKNIQPMCRDCNQDKGNKISYIHPRKSIQSV